jgi:16S rRNA pseudouridine516 synthase
MLHKPADYVCSTDDPLHPTVLALLDMADRRDLHTAGRLDLDATGLVLVTDDGAWSHRVTSPRHPRPKVYRVELAEPLTEAAAEQLRTGVHLHGERRPTRPAQVEALSERQVQLTIEEGRYHQVKRMFAAVGNRVLTLHRERIGCVALDPGLAPGEWRPLTAEEVACLGA